MKRLSIKGLLAFLAVAALSAAPLCAQTAEQEDPDVKYASELLEVQSAAPDFTLKTPDGKTVKLSDYKGRYVVLDFWASWCSDCRKDLPNMVAMQEKYAGKGIVFIGVSFDDKKENWTAAIEKYGLGYTQVSELKKWKETEISKAYAIKWIPTLYLIDPAGRVALATVVSEKIDAMLEGLTSCCNGCPSMGGCCQ